MCEYNSSLKNVGYIWCGFSLYCRK